MKFQVNNQLWVPSPALEYALLDLTNRVPESTTREEPGALVTPVIEAINDLVSEPDTIRPELNRLVSIYQGLSDSEDSSGLSTRWITGISAMENSKELSKQLGAVFGQAVTGSLVHQLDGLPAAAESIQGDETKLLSSLTFSLAELMFIIERSRHLNEQVPVCASESIGTHFKNLSLRPALHWDSGTVIVVHPRVYIEELYRRGLLEADKPNTFPGEWLYQLERYQVGFDRDTWVQQPNDKKAIDVWWCYYKRVAEQTSAAPNVDWIDVSDTAKIRTTEALEVIQKTAALKQHLQSISCTRAQACLSAVIER